ncbi:MAG: DUF1905 domain-containing protein [Cytophagales bacterium]|nr:DUF1905 domain-containing protein [Cytophagales bacterium]
MIRFAAKLEKQNKPGGWTYLVVTPAHIKKLKAGKKTFRVRGWLDAFEFKRVSLLSFGNGSYLLPFNAAMRKATGKKAGDKIAVAMELDETKAKLSADLLQCLKEEPEALRFFKTLTPFFQNFYSKWVEDAKTNPTKTRRLVALVTTLAQKQGYHYLLETYRNSTL